MSAVYTVGTISVTNGSDIVTGSGTNWVGVIQTGWQIKLPNGEIYWVRQVNSATQLQLENAYTGTSQSNQDYIAGPTGGIARALANKVQDLIGDFQSVVDNAGDGKFADGNLAQPGIRFIADEDTGFRRPSSNTLDVVTGGVQRARFSSSGMNLSGLLSGTAVTQSATDTTSGRVMKVGDFGLGVTFIQPTWPNALLNNPTGVGSGIYRIDGGITDRPTIGVVYYSRRAVADMQQLLVGSSRIYFRNSSGPDSDPQWDEWKVLYDTGSVVGTVSQSSGVPTGAIIERGSNANGEFVRFADGTQICWLNTFSVSGTNNLTASWTFPSSFVSSDSVVTGITASATVADYTGISSSEIGANIASVGASSATLGFRRTSGSSQATMNNNRVFAIGRWF